MRAFRPDLSACLAALVLAGPAGPAPAQTPGLEEAVNALQRSAEVSDPAEARRLAASALPAFRAQAESDGARCRDLFLLGEASIRSGRAVDALAAVTRAEEMKCEESDRLQLRAWALEHAPDGTRRGPGAQLRASEAAWLRAAQLLVERPERDLQRIAGALGNAAELALLRGADREAYERAVAGLRSAQTAAQREALGLTLLRAGAGLHGEGACLDLVGAHVDENALVRITDVRLRELRAALDARRDDPVALSSVAFYALLAGTQYELYNALRYLQQAVALREDLPDAWYLLGRTREARDQVVEAKQAYRRQAERRPEAPATRLAVNALAYLESEVLSSRQAGEEALARLDAELAKTPREAPFHDTRGRLLAALGRKEEACKEAGYAAALYRDDELRGEVLRWQRAQGCPLGG